MNNRLKILVVSIFLSICVKGNTLESCSEYEYSCGVCDYSYGESFLGDYSENSKTGLLSYFKNPDLAPSNIKEKIKSTKTVEDFLANFEDLVGKEASDQFKSNIMIMDVSRSLQQGRRYLSSSPRGDVIFSFSHEKGKAGGESIEMLFYNPKKSVFELAEISFENGVKVERNPSKCLHCHGQPSFIKPMVDRLLWPHAIPSKAFIDKGSNEHKKLLELRDQVESASQNEKKDRIDFLKLYFENQKEHKRDNDKASFVAYFDRTGKFADNDNSSLGYQTNLNQLNQCRISKMVDNLPIADIIFYITNSCKELKEEEILNLLSDQDKKDIENYFCKKYPKRKGYCSGINNLVKSISDEQNERMINSEIEKDQRRIAVDAMRLDKKDRKNYLKEKSIDGKKVMPAGRESFRKATTPSIFFQLLTEPFGVKQGTISSEINSYGVVQDLQGAVGHERLELPGTVLIDRNEGNDFLEKFSYIQDDQIFDQENFQLKFLPEGGFGNFFTNREGKIVNELGIEGINKELKRIKAKHDRRSEHAQKRCKKNDDLLQKLLSKKDKGMNFPCYKEFDVNVLPIDEIVVNDVKKVTRELIRDDVEKLLKQRCFACHGTGALGAPTYIPMNDMNEFDSFIERHSFSPWGYGSLIVDRLSRATSAHGSMPLGGGLSSEDRTKMIQYIESFKK